MNKYGRNHMSTTIIDVDGNILKTCVSISEAYRWCWNRDFKISNRGLALLHAGQTVQAKGKYLVLTANLKTYTPGRTQQNALDRKEGKLKGQITKKLRDKQRILRKTNAYKKDILIIEPDGTVIDIHEGTRQELADKLKVPIGTVKSRIVRARQQNHISIYYQATSNILMYWEDYMNLKHGL